MLAACILFTLTPSQIDTSNAHPLYDVSPETLKWAWMKGHAIGKNKNGNIDPELEYLRKDLGKIRSPAGQKWRASFAVHLPPFTRAMLNGYQAGRRLATYEEEGQKFVDEVSDATHPERTIQFWVVLNAWPGISDFNGAVIRAADESDVRAEDFILVVDDRVVRLKGMQQAGQSVNAGAVSVPITDSSTISASSGGSTYYSTVTYTRNVIEGFPWFQGSYSLQFPYFDPDGKPYITKDTKSVQLRVVKPRTIQEVAFDMTKAKIKR